MSSAPPPLSTAPKSDDPDAESVILVSYPKIVFLWPTFLLALIAGVYMHVATGSATAVAQAGGGAGAVAVGWMFLIVLSVNLVVLSFDFPRTTSLTLFFVIVALVLGGALMVVYFPNIRILQGLRDFLVSIHPQANATFYYIFFGVMALIYVFVAINRKFDYWEVRPNELLHHHGFMSDLERFPAPYLRLEMEINDVFEYILLGSGRLILHPSEEKRSIVLDNVMWISRKERQITKLLGALQVQVRDQRP